MAYHRLNKFIARLKGHAYRIDPAIPNSYVRQQVLNRLCMILWGKLSRIQNDGLLFLARTAKVRAASRLRAGRGVTIASAAFIDAMSSTGIILGDHTSVGRGTRIEGTGNLQFLGTGLRTGKHVGLGCYCFYGCAGGIEIGDSTIIGDYVSFHSENHVYADLLSPTRLQGVTHRGIRIGNNCWIGAKATILDGVVLGDHSIVAAGAVLPAGNYAAEGVYGGVPARLIRNRKPFQEAYEG
jgi:acetyltransferase-like isoleucine patch superfamily enzyme